MVGSRGRSGKGEGRQNKMEKKERKKTVWIREDERQRR